MQDTGNRIAITRKGMGLTQEEFSTELTRVLAARGEAPVTRGAVAGWEAGKGVSFKNLNAITQLADISLDWLANGLGTEPERRKLREIGERLGYVEASRSGRLPILMPGRIDVRALAAGATLDEGATILFEQPPIGHLPMMPGLVGLRDVYALETTGTSMVPMFKPGDPLYVSPHTPVEKDDAMIVIEHRTRNGSPVAFVKVMVRQTGDAVIARQLNPPLEISYRRKPGLTVHRVLTLREVMGYDGIEAEPDLPARISAGRRGPNA